MTVIIKPINKRDLIDDHNYRIFEDTESLDDDCYPIIKLHHKNHNSYVMMQVPDDCYLLVLKEDE